MSISNTDSIIDFSKSSALKISAAVKKRGEMENTITAMHLCILLNWRVGMATLRKGLKIQKIQLVVIFQVKPDTENGEIC